MDDSAYEKEMHRLEDELKPYLTKDFLPTLVMAAKTIGWSVDYSEIQSFVEEVFLLTDEECPNLEPFQNP